MDDRKHLHDSELLLASMSASRGHLFWELVRAVVDAVVIAVPLCLLLAVGWWMGTGSAPLWTAYLGLFLVLYVLLAFIRFRHWTHSRFRVTTDRILIEEHGRWFQRYVHTIKWPQYQESYVKVGNPFDVFLRTRTLFVRYGTADAHHLCWFPGLSYAEDLKHFLDKVDSAFRAGTVKEVRPFVAKPKGQRDVSA